MESTRLGEAPELHSSAEPDHSRRRSSPGGLRRAVTLLGLALLLAAGGTRAWTRWGPVEELPVDAGKEVRQWSLQSCGPAAVATVLNAHGKSWTREELERRCRVGEQGASLFDLREACRAYGLRAEGQQALSPRGLLRVPRPYIAYLRAGDPAHPQGHFVVVESLRRGELRVYDPSTGLHYPLSPARLHRLGGGWVLRVSR